MFEIGCIYCIENKINGKKYIGQTTRDLKTRIEEHKYSSKVSNAVIYKTIRRYGWENFKVYELESNVEERYLDDLEVMWIEKLDTYTNGYNTTLGGSNRFKLNRKELYSTRVKKYLENTDELDTNLMTKISEELSLNIDYVNTILNQSEVLDVLPLCKREYIEGLYKDNTELKNGILREEFRQKLIKEMKELNSVELVCEKLYLEEKVFKEVVHKDKVWRTEREKEVVQTYLNYFKHFKYQTRYIEDFIRFTYFTREEVAEMLDLNKLYVNDVIRRMDYEDVRKNDLKRDLVRYSELIGVEYLELPRVRKSLGEGGIKLVEIAKKYQLNYEVFRATVKSKNYEDKIPEIKEYKLKKKKYLEELNRMKELTIPIITQNGITLRDVSRITGINYGLSKKVVKEERSKDNILNSYITNLFGGLKNTGYRLTKEEINYYRDVYKVKWDRVPEDLD